MAAHSLNTMLRPKSFGILVNGVSNSNSNHVTAPALLNIIKRSVYSRDGPDYLNEERPWKSVRVDDEVRPNPGKQPTAKDIEDMPVFQYISENRRAKRNVYLFGLGATGALGNEDMIMKPRFDYARRTWTADKLMHAMKMAKKPYPVSFIHRNTKLKDVSCGYGFTVFAATSKDSSHKVFGCGINTNSQIGYHKKRDDGEPLLIVAAPAPIPLPISEGTKILRVASGRSHTVILTDKEGVFTLGNNEFGQCGRPIVRDESLEEKARPRKVYRLPKDIIDVVCGQDHTLFLTEDGQVWSCGWGADGQTGLGVLKSTGQPQQVRGDIEGEKIVKLSGTVDCVLALNDKGEVFGWGNTEYSQFRTVTDEKQMSIPKYLNFSSLGKIISVASGGTNCGLVNEAGNVYVWGFGILGMGPKVEILRKPTKLPEPLFGCNEITPDVKVTDIYAGFAHFAAINDKGDLYMWGKNRHGLLGLGHEMDQYFPLRVSVPLRVTKVSLGVDHTAAFGYTLI